MGDIGHMVNEFSSFARMPEAVLKKGELGPLVSELLSLQKQAYENIRFYFEEDAEKSEAMFDAHQIRQAVTNLIQNSVDSIYLRKENDDNFSGEGEIRILTGHHKDHAFITISDNGSGFPENENVDALTEPYVTHKNKGTGLGLAIVKKLWRTMVVKL